MSSTTCIVRTCVHMPQVMSTVASAANTNITPSAGYLLGYCIESAPGSAGGPVVKEVGGTWVVVGLHRGALVFNNSETKVATLVEAIHRTVVDVSYIPEGMHVCSHTCNGCCVWFGMPWC